MGEPCDEQAGEDGAGARHLVARDGLAEPDRLQVLALHRPVGSKGPTQSRDTVLDGVFVPGPDGRDGFLGRGGPQVADRVGCALIVPGLSSASPRERSSSARRG